MTAGGRNSYSDAVKRRALRMVQRGMHMREVAAKLGISQSAIRAWADKDARPRKQPTSEAILMLQAWPQGAAIFALEGDDLTEG